MLEAAKHVGWALAYAATELREDRVTFTIEVPRLREKSTVLRAEALEHAVLPCVAEAHLRRLDLRDTFVSRAG